MSWPTAIAGGAIGGGVLAFLLHKDGSVELLNKRPWRHYRGYPQNDVTVRLLGSEEFVVEPPTGKGWNIIGAQWVLDTDANAGDRVPYILIQPKSEAATVYLSALLPTLPASHTGIYYLFQSTGGFTYTTGNVDSYILPLPLNGELKAERCTCGILNWEAGDTHRMFLYYEEFDL